MGLLLHTWNEGTVKTIDWKRRISPKEGEDSSICFIDYFKEGITINSEYYANLLKRLSDGIKIKGSHLAKKKVLFRQDNAPIHTSVIAIAKINKLKFLLLPLASYSPDLSISDNFLFSNLKKWLDGQRFANNKEVNFAIDDYFEELDGSH